MKYYKEFGKTYIGFSDVAALILVGCREGEEGGMITEFLSFGGDGCYYAYVLDGEDVEIGEHYSLVSNFKHWMRVYDDENLTFSESADEIRVYRAGCYGVIIQLIRSRA